MTTQPATNGGAKSTPAPEHKAKVKETKTSEAVPVQQGVDPMSFWHTDMERLMEDMFKNWAGMPALKPFTGFLAPFAAGEAPGLEAWRDQAERYFEGLNRRWADMARFNPAEMMGMPARFVLSPEVDISEGADSVVLKAELPGLDKDDLTVEVDGDVVTLSGTKSETKEEKDKDFHHRERRFGSFRRAFKLPEGVVAEEAEAAFDKGVLTITLPKLAAGKGKGRKLVVKG